MTVQSFPADVVAQNRLVEENLPLIGYHVSEVLRRVPAHVDREELASAGAEARVRSYARRPVRSLRGNTYSWSLDR